MLVILIVIILILILLLPPGIAIEYRLDHKSDSGLTEASYKTTSPL
jgi:hypothetical protein